MKRRSFFGLGASALLALPMAALAAGGPKVFMDYTQDELDDAYTQTKWAPNAKEVVDGYETTGAEVRRLLHPLTFSYGAKPSETLDVFAPAGARNLPIQVFIHGGAWRALTKESASGPAPTFVGNKSIFIALNFDNIPENTLPGMVDQCRRALVWIARNAAQFGGNPDRLYLSGHSSGGHLATVMLTTEWEKFGLPRTILKGGLVMSGMCDLRPVMMSVRSSYVKITDVERDELSAITRMERVNCPVIVAWGSRESPEFKRQSLLFADGLRKQGRLAGTYYLEGRTHFEVPNALNTAESVLSQATLGLMNTGI
jgi:arylformamidase